MSKDYSKFKEKYLDSFDVDNVTGEQMIERTNCLECEEYNHEKYYCPIFCDVIREAVKDIRKDSIPVSYIEDTIKWAKENGSDEYAYYLNHLLSVWTEERETNEQTTDKGC